MCRWAAYVGQPIFLEDIVSRPAHSLIRQSQGATRCPTPVNADGFGLAWYGERPEPGLYRDVMPAWSDPNLRSLVGQVRSGLFLAHVRASTGTATSRNNCHPFAVGRWSFMHNGQFGGYDGFRRHADALIDDVHYPHRLGATDSETLFLIALGAGLEDDPKAAMETAIGRLTSLARDRGEAPHMRAACALSDGRRLFALRAASDEHAPSLYYRWSNSRQGFAVVSEPLETDQADWIEVPPGSFCTFERAEVRIEDFIPDRMVRAA
ncbi:class II glutamine amidotransferase [Paracoccus sp. 1_MG-2023]|uniref:class II glutamine amidotransferase n=1 Tax=unclassified Paracoccus (in: a-proteobacteria) TaxID=2688777 RepID=UPI001C09D8BA|nr:MULTISPECIES: class II glutamine amidotransferase [unclassified Paracoccus (in: a-proteobacteria)]MBU2956663.1 class II glutamine amidotransferase [Paracoccus sp. C2R09]MDO6668769.1 class II glutamine amidotransferase [Paracoccus sp. 1_MG-2023]